MSVTDWDDFLFQGIGTGWDITTPLPLPASLRARVLNTVEKFDADWSRFRADSLVSDLAREPGRYQFSGRGCSAGRALQPALPGDRRRHDAADWRQPGAPGV
ncbi:hypothetical protein NicSoilB11_25240 [Arthrobacter sp. NicSoilB11]|nr:hypothetical protein NicSoilB11_25240 [Arthrobacter sp. NicSoilB11]